MSSLQRPVRHSETGLHPPASPSASAPADPSVTSSGRLGCRGTSDALATPTVDANGSRRTWYYRHINDCRLLHVRSSDAVGCGRTLTVVSLTSAHGIATSGPPWHPRLPTPSLWEHSRKLPQCHDTRSLGAQRRGCAQTTAPQAASISRGRRPDPGLRARSASSRGPDSPRPRPSSS